MPVKTRIFHVDCSFMLQLLSFKQWAV